MKDKKCSDFVFMPLGDKARGTNPSLRQAAPAMSGATTGRDSPMFRPKDKNNSSPMSTSSRDKTGTPVWTNDSSPVSTSSRENKGTPMWAKDRSSPVSTSSRDKAGTPMWAKDRSSPVSTSSRDKAGTPVWAKDRSSPVSTSSRDRGTPISELESSINAHTMAGAAAPNSKEVRSKIVVVGSCGCGKSALIHRYVQSQFLEMYNPTGFETHNSQYSVSDTYKIHMSIWDTSGDAGYDGVRHLSYAEADLVIICFAIDYPESMDEVITKWYPEIREHCTSQPVMLVGCKSDRRNEIKAMPADAPRPTFLTYDQGLKTAKLINALVYSETSAKCSQRSVNDVMEVAALSSAGSKSGSSSCSSGTTTTASNGSNDSRGTTASSNSGGSTGADSPNFRRQRSFIRRKRFTGMAEAKVQLRKEAAKSCVVM